MPVLTPELKMQPAGVRIFGAIARYLALALGLVGAQAGTVAGARGGSIARELRLDRTFTAVLVKVVGNGKPGSTLILRATHVALRRPP